MASTICSVSLKRQRSFPRSPHNATQEQLEGSLANSSDSGSALPDRRRQRPLHLQESSSCEEMMLKSRSNRPWFAPRPLIVSMLNNKGVIYVERQQYEEARKSFTRALRLSQKEEKTNEFNVDTTMKNETTVSASTKTSGCNNGIKSNAKNNAAHLDGKKNFEIERTNYFVMKSTACISVTDKRTSVANAITDGIQTSSAPNAQSQKLDTREQSSAVEKFCGGDGRKSSKDSGLRKPSTERSIRPAKTEYDEGMDCFKSPFRLLNGSLSLNGTILFNLGRISHDEGNFEEALFFYKRSLFTIEQESSRDENLAMAVLVGIGNVQYVKDDHVESLNTYMTALALAQTCFGEKSLEVAACLNCIGVLHYMMSTGDDDIALDALETSLHQRIKLLGPDHIDVGTTWNNIGRMYFQLGKFDMAMEAYCEALRIRRKCQGESVDVAATLFNCGQVYHNLECRDKALSLFQEFLKLAKTHFGEFHRDVCIVTTCIGQVLHESKDYENALKSFKHALRIGHVALGPVHSEMAITLNKMGNLYYETGDFDSALSAYHQGLEIETAVLETGNPNTYVTYTNIAEIHKQKGEYVQAMEYYQKVYEVQIDHGAENLELATTLSNIGYTKQQLEDLDGALEANQECLRLRREVFGDTHEDVASTLTHIALVLLKLERHDIALQVFTEAYRIRKAIPSSDTSSLAFTMYNIAHIYHHQGSHDNALRFYLATVEVEKGLNIAHVDLSITYYNIGQLFYQRGEMELALSKFNEAHKIERECYGENHPTCARTLNEIGNIEMQLGNIEGMMKCYTEALRIYKEAGMVDELVVYSLSLWRFNMIHPEAAPVA